MTQLAKVIDPETLPMQNDELPVQHDSANPITAMLQEVTKRGITPENAAALEKLTDLYLKVEAVNASKAFALAKAALQAELPRVEATGTIPNKDGTVRSTFAPFEAIMEAVQPCLVKHGFSVSFNIRVDDKRLCAVCILTHSGGHTASNEFSVRVGSGPPGCSEAQADGAARSYARRGALCDALNIVVDKDTDARLEGAYITMNQAAELRRRVTESGSNVAAFLKVAGVEQFEDVRTGQLNVLHNMLKQKEEAKRKAGPVAMSEQEKSDISRREVEESKR